MKRAVSILAVMLSLVVGLWAETAQAQAPSPSVCNRTPAVRDVILYKLGVNNCAAVTREQLAGMTNLDFDFIAITALKQGDFSGLSNLKQVSLRTNFLTTLPAGIFSGLSNLEVLYLQNNSLTSLPAGIFSGLSNLEVLDLEGNSLTTLPVGIFSGLSNLKQVSLQHNSLTTLPVGIFSGLSNLELVYLNGNILTALPAGIFHGLKRSIVSGENSIFISDDDDALLQLNPGYPFDLDRLFGPPDGTTEPPEPPNGGFCPVPQTNTVASAQAEEECTCSQTYYIQDRGRAVPQTESDPDCNRISKAIRLAENTTKRGVITNHRDKDYFQFTMPADKESVEIHTDRLCSGCSFALYELDLSGSLNLGTATHLSSGSQTLTLGPGDYIIEVSNSVTRASYSIGLGAFTLPPTELFIGFDSGRDRATWYPGFDYTIYNMPYSISSGKPIQKAEIVVYGSDSKMRLDNEMFSHSQVRKVAVNSNPQIGRRSMIPHLSLPVPDKVGGQTYYGTCLEVTEQGSNTIERQCTTTFTLSAASNSAVIESRYRSLRKEKIHEDEPFQFGRKELSYNDYNCPADLAERNMCQEQPSDWFYRIEPITATEGADYFHCRQGNCEDNPEFDFGRSGNIWVIDDSESESSEGFRVVYYYTVRGKNIEFSTTGTIIDDDSDPRAVMPENQGGESAQLEFRGVPESRAVTATSFNPVTTENRPVAYTRPAAAKTQFASVFEVNISGGAADPFEICFPAPSRPGDPVIYYGGEDGSSWEKRDSYTSGTMVCTLTQTASFWAVATENPAVFEANRLILPRIAMSIAAETAGTIQNRIQAAFSGDSSSSVSVKGGNLQQFLIAEAQRGELPDLQLSDFAFTIAADDSPTSDGWRNATGGVFDNISAWGRGYFRHIDIGGDINFDGAVTGGMVGVDTLVMPNLLTGVSGNLFRSEIDFSASERTGTHETAAWSVHPYIGWQPSPRTTLWATGGYGMGDLEVTEDGEVCTGDRTSTCRKSDLMIVTFGVGGSGRMFDRQVGQGRVSIDAIGDLVFARFMEDGEEGIDTDTGTARFGFELSGSRPVFRGGTLGGDLELAYRGDFGDAIGGSGLEVAGGVKFGVPRWGLRVDLDGRALVSHSDDVKERGFSGDITWSRNPDGTGPFVSFNPQWGATNEKSDTLWEHGITEVNTDTGQGQRYNVEVGYGVPLMYESGMMKVFARSDIRDGVTISKSGGVDVEINGGFTTGYEAVSEISRDHTEHRGYVRLKGTF